MTSELILIILSSIILFSYILDIFSSKIKLPSVVILIGTGLILRAISNWVGYEIPYIDKILAPLGTVGLLLIVLEAGLELEINFQKVKLIKKSLSLAISGLLLCLFLIAGVFYYISNTNFRICLINALPFAIISSAIAIPASKLLIEQQREFITYESSFSDILGVVIFNFLLFNSSFGLGSFFSFFFELITTGIFSIVFSIALAKLIEKIEHPVKHLPLFAIILLVYSSAKAMHFSPLLLVLVFGLLLKNVNLIIHGNMRTYFNLEKLNDEIKKFNSVISEATFVIRTFFFVILGYSVNIKNIIDQDAIAIVLPVILIIYSSRALLSRALLNKIDSATLTYVAPRGLISILLFISIPRALNLFFLSDRVLLWIIFTTSIIMAWGITKHTNSKEQAIEKQ